MPTIYTNGTILTMENESEVEAILVQDGIIAKIGTLDEVKQNAPTDVKLHDLKGATMLPGFIDTHGHITLSTQTYKACNLSECNTYEQIIEILTKAKEYAPEEGILAYACDHNQLPNSVHPTAEILDQVATDIPIAVLGTSAHIGSVNSFALKNLLNITAATPDPPSGKIGRIKGTMEPNGYLEGTALFPVVNDLNNFLQLHIFDYIEATQLEYLRNGVTTAQDGATTSTNISLFKMLAEENKLLIDVVAYPNFNAESRELVDHSPEYTNGYNNHYRLGGYTVVLDGALQSKLAWLTRPYEDSGYYSGHAHCTNEEVEAIIQAAIEDNQQIQVHCHGDASAEQLIYSYQKVLESTPTTAFRPVMLHCQILKDEQLEAMKELDIVPSVFVGQVYYMGDTHVKNLGEHRGNNISPIQAIINKGLPVTLNTNSPMSNINPLFAVWAAVNRVTKTGNILGKHQQCSVYEALKAITINAAYTYFEEDTKGSIKEGKIADLVILNKNPLKVDPMEIKDIQVLETIKNGINYAFLCSLN